MGRDLWYRGRLLIYAVMAALGGAVASGGQVPRLWIMAPLIAVVPLAAAMKKTGRRLACLLACLVFLYGGLLLGYARSCAWRGRGGSAGHVSLLGEIEVGCRGEQGDIVELFRVTEVIEGQAARCGDRYLLRPRNEGSLPRWGDVAQVQGSLFIFQKQGGGIGGSLSADEVSVIAHTGNPLLRLALGYRDALRSQVEGQLGSDAAGLIEGMVLGDYRLLNARDLMAFRLAGLIHLCAASGLNVGILAAFIIWIGRRLRLARRVVVVLQAPLLMTYALAVGLSVPIQIATVVALLAAAAFLWGRDFDYLPALGLAIIYMVLRDPSAANGVSFQLCLAAILGMVLLQRPLHEFLKGGKSKTLALLAATLAAQLVVGPVLLYHFGEVSVLALVSNLVVLPLVPLVMALAMLSSLVGIIALPLAGWLHRAAGAVASCILLVARAMAAPPWAVMRIAPFSPAWMAVYYPALAASFLAGGKWRRMGRIVLTALVATALLLGCLMQVASLGLERGTRIIFIDVGQGDSTLLEVSSGARVLVDGGMDERVLAADLRSRGLRYLDAVIVSHPDADHVGGLEGALETCRVGSLIHPATKDDGLMGDLLGKAGEMGIPARTMRRGDRLQLGELRLTACEPPLEIPDEAESNEYSLVLRVEGPGFSVLLPGDVEEEGERRLMDEGCDLRCDILKIPHHGGFVDSNAEFLSHVKPRIAVICVGEDNPYGHPAAATIDSLRDAGCFVYRTDLCGDIVIRVAEGGYRVECER